MSQETSLKPMDTLDTDSEVIKKHLIKLPYVYSPSWCCAISPPSLTG